MSIELMNKGTLTREQKDLIKKTICDGATDDEAALFLEVCKTTRLDPFNRQIWAVKRKAKDNKTGKYVEKMTHQVSIDGLRLIAERTGKYMGQSAPMWCGEDGKWVEVWLKNTNPLAAKVSVYRKDFQEPITAIAKFDSYAQKYEGMPTGQWKTMPDNMIAKCAEALALRKGFPNDLSGIYTEEELGQMDNVENEKIKGQLQEKDLQLDRESAIEMHKDLISGCQTIDSLAKTYRAAVGFARSIGNLEVAKDFEKIKDVVKNSLTSNNDSLEHIQSLPIEEN